MNTDPPPPARRARQLAAIGAPDRQPLERGQLLLAAERLARLAITAAAFASRGLRASRAPLPSRRTRPLAVTSACVIRIYCLHAPQSLAGSLTRLMSPRHEAPRVTEPRPGRLWPAGSATLSAVRAPRASRRSPASDASGTSDRDGSGGDDWLRARKEIVKDVKPAAGRQRARCTCVLDSRHAGPDACAALRRRAGAAGAHRPARDAAISAGSDRSAMPSAIACVRRSRPARRRSRGTSTRSSRAAYLLFQVDPLGDAEDLPASFAARYDRWHATSKYPRLIKNFYLFTLGADEPALRSSIRSRDRSRRSSGPHRCRTGAPMCSTPTAEPSTRPEAAITSSAGSDRRFGTRCRRSSCRHRCCRLQRRTRRAPAFDVAARDPTRFCELDESYMSREMLPALARAALHAERRRGDSRLAVVSRAPDGRVIYHSSDAFNPAPGAHADATADLFAIRTQDFSRVASEIHRFMSFAATSEARVRRSRPAGSEPTS